MEVAARMSRSGMRRKEGSGQTAPDPGLFEEQRQERQRGRQGGSLKKALIWGLAATAIGASVYLWRSPETLKKVEEKAASAITSVEKSAKSFYAEQTDGIRTYHGIRYKKTEPVTAVPFSGKVATNGPEETARFADFIRHGVLESDQYVLELEVEGNAIRGGKAKCKFDQVAGAGGVVLDGGTITATEAKFTVDYGAPIVKPTKWEHTIIRHSDGHMQHFAKGPSYTESSKSLVRVGDSTLAAPASTNAPGATNLPPATRAAPKPADTADPQYTKLVDEAADRLTDSIASEDLKGAADAIKTYRTISQNPLAKPAQKAQALAKEAEAHTRVGDMVQKKSGRQAAATHYNRALQAVIEYDRLRGDTEVDPDHVRLLQADAFWGLGKKSEAKETYRQLAESRNGEVAKAAAEKFKAAK
jgi:hypothetical protein